MFDKTDYYPVSWSKVPGRTYLRLGDYIIFCKDDISHINCVQNEKGGVVTVRLRNAESPVSLQYDTLPEAQRVTKALVDSFFSKENL